MSELSWAPRRRTESYHELVAQTATSLSRDLTLGELLEAARALVCDFFEADAAVVILRSDDDADAESAAAELSALHEHVFAERTLRVLRGEAALRSGRGRSLHAPIRFGTKLLGAVAVMGTHADGYSASDLALLEGWATLVGVHVNGRQLAAQNSALEALVGTDGLTGLRNRRGLDAELDVIWRAARRSGESIAIVMVDVDFFKSYNDTFGHLAGDGCLVQIATTLAAGLRPGDIAARFGGEEFVALLRDADRDRAVRIAERLRENVLALQIPHPGSTREFVTASFGVATAIPRAGGDAAESLAAADKTLYAAKAAGRNRVAADGYFVESPAVSPRFGGDHNLPTMSSSFCGRVDDINAVLEALERSRLVSLIAFGGVGKTRLSIEVAGKCCGRFRNGVWFVDLAGSSDPELLPERVAAAIGLPDVPGSRSIAGVAELLAGRELLIVLDNCEHLIAACARFCAEVLAGAPAVVILATSREALNLPEEIVIPLAPLALPDDGAYLGPADLAKYPALKLFIDRAAAIAPIALSTENIGTIGKICRRLDGIALAIELAAARVRMLSLDELERRLATQFTVVGRSSGPGSARQRTLRGLIDWSYDLLDERERLVFSRLGVFAGPFTLELANAVCSDDGDDVLDVLEDLVDKSLVVLDAHESGIRAFRLFESIREYARDRLTATGQAEELRRRLLARIAAHGTAIAGARSTAHWRTSMEPLEHSVADVRACLELTIVADVDRQTGVLLAADMAEYWQVRGRAHEGRTWIERALAISDLGPGLRAKLLNSYLWHQPLFGDAWRSAELAAEALQLATEANDELQISFALAHISDAAFDLGDFTRAYDFGIRAIDRFVAEGELYGEAYACNCIGVVVDIVGADAQASAEYTWYYRSIEISRRIERHGFAARVIGNVAESEFFLGKVDDGIAMTKAALADCRRENDRPAMGWLLCNLGLFHQSTGEFEVARDMLLDALRIVIEIRDHWLVAACCDNLAGIALHFGRPERAAQFLGCADAIFTEIVLTRQPVFQKIADTWRARVRSLLGEERYVAELATGGLFSRAQTLTQAQKLAKDGAELRV